MEARAGGDIENLPRAAPLQFINKEPALAFRAGLPVNQLVPFVHEGLDVLVFVMVGMAGVALVGKLPRRGYLFLFLFHKIKMIATWPGTLLWSVETHCELTDED
jgi:hypothetical protein